MWPKRKQADRDKPPDTLKAQVIVSVSHCLIVSLNMMRVTCAHHVHANTERLSDQACLRKHENTRSGSGEGFRLNQRPSSDEASDEFSHVLLLTASKHSLFSGMRGHWSKTSPVRKTHRLSNRSPLKLCRWNLSASQLDSR